jgi:DnaJ-class molecular chaperone
MRDPYDVLGVQRTADAAAIKSAFRKLAKKHHPDANSDPKAAQRFAEVNSAYEILGDAAKRKAFDRGEIDADGKQRFQAFEGFRAQPGGGFRQADFETIFPGGFARGGRAGGFGGFEDLLKGMFGGAAGRRTGFEPHPEVDEMPSGRDVTVPVTISLHEAAQGVTRRVRLPNGKEVDVKIPVGLADGQQIRLKGQGLPGAGAGGGVGDALIAVTIAPHKLFAREGANLRMELPVTLYEAVLGAKVRVPTLDGAVELAIPAGTSSGRTFRLKGKGMPGKGAPGDLHVAVRIVLPEGGDEALSDLMRKWRDGKPYDPRKD